MIQGSDISLEIFIKNYLYQFTRSLHTINFVLTNNQSEQFSNELDTTDSSHVVSSNAMKFTSYQKLMITVFKRMMIIFQSSRTNHCPS